MNPTGNQQTRWEYVPGRSAERWILWAVTLALFVAVYGRTISWGWLGFDDYSLISTNKNLGHGWSSLWWALSNVRGCARWMPLGWLPVAFGGTAFQLHVLVLVLGAALCVFVAEMFRSLETGVYAFPFALLFLASPLRLEVFGWVMGYLYTLTAIFGVLAVLDRDTRWRSILWIVCALLTYPQAAGFALIAIWYWRGTRGATVLTAVLLGMVLIQYFLRAYIGWIPIQRHWSLVPLTLGHEFVSLVAPMITVPIFPASYYPLEWLGFAIIALLLFWQPRMLAVLLVLILPTLAASVTEFFAFGARYSLFIAIGAYGMLGVIMVRSAPRYAPAVLLGLAAIWTFGNLTDNGFANGRYGVELRALSEAKVLGVTIKFAVPQADK
jgi:hypothetical protein